VHEHKHIVRFCDLGRTRYAEAWNLQKKIHAAVSQNRFEDIFITNEHEHVYTLGKGGDENHLLVHADELRAAGAEFFPIDRGGDITYHGPGQIVGYPILNLERFNKDIHWYLRQLEEVIIRTLRRYDIVGERSDGETGVWIGNEKIAAIGIKVSRWVTMHGFAFNICTDLSYFGKIIPCGIFHKGVTSLAEILKEDITITDVMPVVKSEFESVFNITLHSVPRPEIEQELTLRTIREVMHVCTDEQKYD
jgi:lipoyl(octanoyl) transferase